MVILCGEERDVLRLQGRDADEFPGRDLPGLARSGQRRRAGDARRHRDRHGGAAVRRQGADLAGAGLHPGWTWHHATANRRSVGTSAPTPYIGGRRNECLELIRQTCENACWWRLKPVSQPTRLRKSSWLAAPRSTAGWRRLMTKAAVRPSRWGAARNRSSAMRPRWRCAACWRRTIT